MTVSKRDAIKAQRARKKRQQRRNTILWVGGFIILVVLLLASPTIINSLKPVGSFTRITPFPRSMENGKTIGDPNAKVKIQIYEDFQCPYCKEFTESDEKQLMQSTYITSGQVYYEYMEYPVLDQGLIKGESHQASNASMCALEQGKFWDYHDLLYTNQGAENSGNFSDKRLQAFAESLGLDMTKFNECFNADKYATEINADIKEGNDLGIKSTPSIVINGKIVSAGYLPYDQLKSAIDAALASGN